MAFPLDPTETLDAAALGALIDAKLRDLVAAARAGSPWHAARLGDWVFSGRADLARVPVADKDAWVAATPPHGTGALTRELGAAYVFRSGGSTGEPKFAYYAHTEFVAAMPYFIRSYGAVGLRPGDRVANLFAAGGLYASFVFVGRMLEELGCLSFPYTAGAAPDVVADGAARFGFDALLGFPSWLMQVAPALNARGARVPKIFYAGEHLHPDDRAKLQDWLGAETIASAGYAGVDSGLIGHQCTATTGGAVHHVLADHCYAEIEPDGQLVVTNLDRRLHPVIRYRVGDRARWVEGPCPCGRTTPRFELLGRGDDALRIGYATVTRAEVLAALAGEPAVGAAVQLAKVRVGDQDGLVLRLEAEAPDAGLAARLRATVLAAKPDVAKLIAGGSVADLMVEVLAPGAIPRVPVTGKFRGTVDETR